MSSEQPIPGEPDEGLPVETFQAVPSDLSPAEAIAAVPLPPLPPGPDAPLDVVAVVGPVRRPQPGLILSFLLCIAFILITQVPAALLAAVIMVVLSMANPEQSTLVMGDSKALLQSDTFSLALMPAMLVAELLVIGVSWLAIRLVSGKDWPRIMALRLPSLTQLVLVVLALPGLVFLGNGAYELTRYFLPGMQDLGLTGMEEMVKVFGTWPMAFAVLVIGVGPGIGEELWCRAFLGRGLVGRYGVWLGVAFTSFFFGLIHVDPRQGFMAMLMGVALHYVYLTTRSLLMPMLLHFLNNSLAVVASRLEARGSGWEEFDATLKAIDATPGDISPAVYAFAGLLLVAVCLALYLGRARLVATESWRPLWDPGFSSVEYPPPGSGTVVVRPWPGWLVMGLVVASAAGFVASFVFLVRQAMAA